jgi:hypothetical protein
VTCVSILFSFKSLNLPIKFLFYSRVLQVFYEWSLQPKDLNLLAGGVCLVTQPVRERERERWEAG